MIENFVKGAATVFTVAEPLIFQLENGSLLATAWLGWSRGDNGELLILPYAPIPNKLFEFEPMATCIKLSQEQAAAFKRLIRKRKRYTHKQIFRFDETRRQFAGQLCQGVTNVNTSRH